MKKISIGNPHVATPYVAWCAIFIIVPLLMVGYYSFTDEAGNFTLDNITKIVEYNYLKIFGVSILYALIATIITLLISYPLAYFMTKTKLSAQGTLMLLVMLPMWMNLLIRTYSLSNILERNGLINTFLESIGLEKVQLINTSGAVILGMVYNFIPYMILPIYSALSKLDGEERMIVVLSVLHGYTNREIAGMIGKPQGTVSSKLHRTYAKLREMLGGENDG